MTGTISGETIDRLRAIVGDRHVLTDPDLTAPYATDWTRRFSGRTQAVVRPANTDEVAEIVRVCAAERIALVPQGGNTGLVGGSVPLSGEIVVSLTRLNDIDDVDVVASQVTAGAGVALAALQRAAISAGLAFGVDLAARDTATIGGMIATNAGGLQFVRHGGMRQQVVGIEAVLGDGSVVSRLGGVQKDNTGYDLAGLLCGSEGTLGIVTAARLRLVSPPAHRVTALAGFATLDAALAGLATLRGQVTLEAAEVVFADGVAMVCDHLRLAPPLAAKPPVMLLVEWAGDDLSALGTIDVVDAAVGDDTNTRAGLWRYREAHTEAIAASGIPHKLDVALPLSSMAAFVDEVRAATSPHRTILFGHIADGNLHVNVLGPPPGDESVDDAVLQLVASHGGSISAEHGIGTAKRRWLHVARSPAEVAAFRALKSALDPSRILNPNVLLPPA